MKPRGTEEQKRIETRAEVETYIARLKYTLQDGGAHIQLQQYRKVDSTRLERYTNRYTLSDLFPDEDPVEALKRELSQLDVVNYVETVKDTKFVKRSEMRVFSKKYSGKDVYIKIRVEVLAATAIFVMSFHYAEKEFIDADFPYSGKEG
jgi:hypothetical protein